MIASNLPALIPVLTIFGAVSVLAVGIGRPKRAYAVFVAVLSLSCVAAFGLLARVLAEGPIHYSLGGWPPPYGIEFVVDRLNAFVAVIVTTIALLVASYARVAVRTEAPGREPAFYSMSLVLLLGLSGMVLTGDLFNLYVFFEISSLAAYALISVGDRRAVVAAYRYLILGTLGASFYLLGLGFLYTITGSLNMADIARLIQVQGSHPMLLVAAAFMLAGLGLKMAIFPMHMWLPDSYTYASSTATAIIAPLMTKVSAYVLVRLLYFVFRETIITPSLPILSVLTWLSLAGIVVGSVMAIAQVDPKRMLAYSSVAQVAYIGAGIGIGTPLAVAGAMLHVLNHAAMKCCLFLVTGAVELQTGHRDLRRFAGLGRTMPWTFFPFTLAALAMVGVPPTGGFFSKWYLVLGGLQSGSYFAVGIILASSLLTAVYFFRVLERVYTLDPTQEPVRLDPPLAIRIPTLTLGIAVVVVGLFNSWFVSNLLTGLLPVSLGAGH